MSKSERPLTLTDLRTFSGAALTRSQVAGLFGVDPRTITRAIHDGELPSVRLGNRVFIPTAPLLAMLEAKQPVA